MIKKAIKDIVKKQVEIKASQLSTWQKVQYEGGRLYYETSVILKEIAEYPLEIKIFYLETLLKEQFLIQDNWPGQAPDITSNFRKWVQTHISQLKIKRFKQKDSFLDRVIDEISLEKVNIKNDLKQILILRIEEIKKCIKGEAYLAMLFLTGSTLEGLLFGFALTYPKAFNLSPAAPKDNNNQTKAFNFWTLSDFINVAYDLELINEDVNKHSHALREFRNYIHPREQLNTLFIPDSGTSNINWQVLKACIIQIVNNESKLTKI